MELTIPQLAAIISMLLIARTLSKKRRKKEKEDIDSLYPPSTKKQNRIPDHPEKGIFAGVKEKRNRRQEEIDSLYPPKKESQKTSKESEENFQNKGAE